MYVEQLDLAAVMQIHLDLEVVAIQQNFVGLVQELTVVYVRKAVEQGVVYVQQTVTVAAIAAIEH